MPFYRITGKWYHLAYSHHFSETEEANSPKEALRKFALHVADTDDPEEVEWESGEPKEVHTGKLNTKASFWVGSDQNYQVRSIKEVQTATVTCPECNDRGVIASLA